MLDRLEIELSEVGDQLTSLAVGVAELAIAILLASFISRRLRRRLRPRIDAIPSGSVAVLAENGVSIAVYVVFGTILLALWGLTWGNLIAVLGFSTIAVAFGFQDFLRSIVGGVLVVFEKPFSPGDRIKVRDAEGRVESVALRTTTIMTDDGDRIVLPNALVFSDPVVNKSPNRRRLMLTLTGIDGDPAEVRERAHLAFAEVVPGRRPEVRVRTKQPRVKVREAIDALPGVELRPPAKTARPRAVGLTIRWHGDGGRDELDGVTAALLRAFPGSRAGPGAWR